MTPVCWKALNGIAPRADPGLLKTENGITQTITCGNQDLGTHNVQAGDLLRYRMFHLNPWVDLDEVKCLGIDVIKELHSSRIVNPTRSTNRNSGIENVLPDVTRQLRSRSDFDDLLMPALNGAIAFIQVDQPTIPVHLSFQHTGLAVVLQGLVRPRLRGTELEFWRNSEEARTDRPSQQLRSLNGEWRLMRYFLLTHLCGISHRIWCTLSTICSDAA